MVRWRARALVIIAVAALAAACGLGLYVWGERREPGGGAWDAPSSDRLSGPARPGDPGELGGCAGASAGSPGQGAPPGKSAETGASEDVLPGASTILEGTKIIVPGPSGGPEWSFSADKVEMAANQKVVRLSGVEGSRHIGGAPEALVRAGRLTADLDSGRIEFEGGVQVATGGKAGFSARSASWDAKARRFSAVGDVRYHHGGASISGDVLYADARLEVASVRGRVRFSTVVEAE